MTCVAVVHINVHISLCMCYMNNTICVATTPTSTQLCLASVRSDSVSFYLPREKNSSQHIMKSAPKTYGNIPPEIFTEFAYLFHIKMILLFVCII